MAIGETYEEFTEKFKPKRTTDDCYTPAPVYEAVLDWALTHIPEVAGMEVLRPFYPGGDFEAVDYKPGQCVIDNPPFSIFMKIVNFYHERGVKFLLFAPALTANVCEMYTIISMKNTSIEYDNGAKVCTSFVTNMLDPDIALTTAPDLSKAIKEASEREAKTKRVQLKKNAYPRNVTTVPLIGAVSGVDFFLRRGEFKSVGALDSMKHYKKGIFPGGLLLSDAAAERLALAKEEKAAKEEKERENTLFWDLSDRERAIIEELNRRVEKETEVRPGSGNALRLDELVCTPLGSKRIGDIKTGDVISNPNTGNTQLVTCVHPVEIHDYYRVHFVDGTYIDCPEGHRWKCHRSSYGQNGIKYKDNVWRTDEMYDWYSNKDCMVRKWHHLAIPLTSPIQFTKLSHKWKTDPYVIGAMVGDGCLQSALGNSNVLRFTSIEEEVRERFEQCGYDISHCPANESSVEAKCLYIQSKELVDELRGLGLLGCDFSTAFIPSAYKIIPIEDRKKLMQGLIDTEGRVDKRGVITYTTVSNQLAKDVAYVVRSLGGIATITKNTAGHKKNGKYIECEEVYDVKIITKINHELCGLMRKRGRAMHGFNAGSNELEKRIIDIEPIGRQEGRGITVESQSGQFVAKNFTVTLN